MAAFLSEYWVYCLFAGLALLLILGGGGKLMSSLLFSVISGLGSLTVVSMLSTITGISVAVNLLSLLISSLLGLPGVGLLVALELLCV